MQNLELGQWDQSACSGYEAFDFRVFILGYEQHISWLKMQVLAQISLILHFFYVDKLSLYPFVGSAPEQNNLRMFGTAEEPSSHSNSLGHRRIAAQIIFARSRHLAVGDEVRFFKVLQDNRNRWPVNNLRDLDAVAAMLDVSSRTLRRSPTGFIVTNPSGWTVTV